MRIKKKLLIAAGALTLAVLGITGAVAAGRANDDTTDCKKSDCAEECPKKAPCVPRADCPGC